MLEQRLQVLDLDYIAFGQRRRYLMSMLVVVVAVVAAVAVVVAVAVVAVAVVVAVVAPLLDFAQKQMS